MFDIAKAAAIKLFTIPDVEQIVYTAGTGKPVKLIADGYTFGTNAKAPAPTLVVWSPVNTVPFVLNVVGDELFTDRLPSGPVATDIQEVRTEVID